MEKFLHSRIAVYCTLAVLALAQYWHMLEVSFFSDDFGFLHRAIYDFSLYKVFVRNFFTGFFYRPISFDLSFRTGYMLFGLNPAGYRLLVLLVFFFNCILTYEIISLLTRRKDLGFLGALFFVTREAHAAGVFWLSAGFQQFEATFFMLGTFYFFLHYSRTRRTGFYLGSLACALLALLSRESAIVLPLLIVVLEYSRATKLRELFSARVVLRVVPFCLVTVVSLSRLVLDTPLNRAGDVFYSKSFVPAVAFENLLFFIRYSYNTVPEGIVLALWVLGTCLGKKQGRLFVAACGLFLLGILVHINISKGLSSYYLCFSLMGLSLLVSIGMLRIQNRMPALKPVVFVALAVVFLASFVSARQSEKNCRELINMERIARTTVGHSKKMFPAIADESLIYIQNGDTVLKWGLVNGKAFKALYNDSVSVYFEGISTKNDLPDSCSGIYVFDYRNQALHFIQFIEGDMLKEFLKKRAHDFT